jgi:WD40 repeat protein
MSGTLRALVRKLVIAGAGLITMSGGLSAQGTIVIESDPALAVTYSPDGKYIACGGLGDRVRLWDSKSGALVRSFDGETARMKITRAVSVSPDSKLLAAGGDDGYARVWEIATGKLILAWIGHNEVISSLTFSPDGKHLAVASCSLPSEETRIRLREIATGRIGRTITAAKLSTIAFSPDSRSLAVAEGPVKIWELATGKLQQTLKPAHGDVSHLAFSADGKILAAGGGHYIAQGGGTIQIAQAWVWDVETGKLRRSFTDLNTWMRSIALSPDGTRLATGCTGREKREGPRSWVPSELKVWDTATGRELWALHGGPGSVHAIAFAPDGASVVSCEDDSVRLADANTGKITRVLRRTKYGPAD